MVSGRLSRNWAFRVTAILMPLVVNGMQPAASADNGPYLSDLPKQFATAYANWTQSVPYAIDLADWLTKLNGIASPIRDVSVHGTRLKFGTVCVPHDCGDNTAGVLFTPRQDRVVAVVRMTSRNSSPTTMVIGNMKDEEVSCIRRFTYDDKLTVC
jgi:hypothetical protein